MAQSTTSPFLALSAAILRTRILARFGLLLAALVALSTPAHAQERASTAPSELEQAERAYAELNWDAAAATAEQLIHKGGLSHEYLARAYRLKFLCYATLDKTAEAKAAAVRLIMLDPDYTLPKGSSPKFGDILLEARAYWRDQPQRPGLEVTALTKSTEVPALRITLRDPEHVVARLSVAHRWGVVGKYTMATANPGAGVGVLLSAPPAGMNRFDYYVSALDSADSVIFEFGSEGTPKSSIFERPRRDPIGGGGHEKDRPGILSSPVFWVVSAVVIAGAATGAYFLLKNNEPEKETVTRPTGMTIQIPGIGCNDGKCN